MGQSIDLNKIQKDYQRQQNQKDYLGQILELVQVPWTINQCLQANKLPQAAQLIISFEYAFPEKEHPLLLDLVCKEVALLKQKVVQTLFIFLETSYIQATQSNSPPGASSPFYSTKVNLNLLRILGEKEEKTH